MHDRHLVDGAPYEQPHYPECEVARIASAKSHLDEDPSRQAPVPDTGKVRPDYPQPRNPTK